MGTCQWSGLAIRTAWTSLRSRTSLYFFVTNAFGSASLRACSRATSQTSQTAAMRTLGTLASACISWRQRPPVPIRPTLSVSLAPQARGVTAAAVRAAAAEVFRKARRVVMREALGADGGNTEGYIVVRGGACGGERLAASRNEDRGRPSRPP